MKKFTKWIEDNIKKLRWYDISLIKIATVSTTLLVVKVFPNLLALDLMYYIIIALIASLIPLHTIFCKKGKR